MQGHLWTSEAQYYDYEYADIPVDGNGNQIADAWEKDADPGEDRSTPEADDETGPGPGNKGDGLSVFVEYRGFVVGGAWYRTSVLKKDVFINSDIIDNGVPHAYGYAYMLPSPMQPWHVDTGEYKVAGRGINHRGTDVPGHKLQKALLVRGDEDPLAAIWGFTHSLEPWQYVPRTVYLIDVHLAKLRMSSGILAEPFISEPEDERYFRRTIAHEIGHGIDLHHCDEPDCIMRPGSQWLGVKVYGYTGDPEDEENDHNHSNDYDLTYWGWLH